MPTAFHSPPISRNTSLLLQGFVSSLYVVSLYISQLYPRPRRPTAKKPAFKQDQPDAEDKRKLRDDPDIIKRRSAAAILSTGCSCILVSFVLWWANTNVNGDLNSGPVWDTALARLGLSSRARIISFANLRPYLITPLLFTGPLYATWLGEVARASISMQIKKQPRNTYIASRISTIFQDLLGIIRSWIGFRNYIMAPITEELSYRACICAFARLAGFGRKFTIFLTPCWFGLAHVHHGYQTYVQYGRNPQALQRAVISSSFQFSYTTLFGWLCTFLFLRTGSIYVPITAHTFCNVMGVPQIGWELRAFPAQRQKIWAAYIAGVVLFVLTLGPWTRNEESLYWNARP